MAHRGNNEDELENSWSALISAERLGIHALEFDVIHSLDGVPFLMHDDTLKSTAKDRPGKKKCNVKTKINQMTWNEIHSDCQLKNNEDIPLLIDVLHFFKNSPAILFVELKDSYVSPFTFQMLKSLFEDQPEKLRVISFHLQPLETIRSLGYSDPFFSKIKTFYLAKNGPFPILNHQYDLKYSDESLNFLKSRPIGEETAVWTVDFAFQMKKIKKAGITWITTNNPEKCLRVVGSNI